MIQTAIPAKRPRAVDLIRRGEAYAAGVVLDAQGQVSHVLVQVLTGDKPLWIYPAVPADRRWAAKHRPPVAEVQP
jgi:hypothetical protein